MFFKAIFVGEVYYLLELKGCLLLLNTSWDGSFKGKGSVGDCISGGRGPVKMEGIFGEVFNNE